MIRKRAKKNKYINIIVDSERYEAGGGVVIAANKLTVESTLSCRGYFPSGNDEQNIPVAF